MSPPQRTQQGPLHELQTSHTNRSHSVALHGPRRRVRMVSLHWPYPCTGLYVLAHYRDVQRLQTMCADGPVHARRQAYPYTNACNVQQLEQRQWLTCFVGGVGRQRGHDF